MRALTISTVAVGLALSLACGGGGGLGSLPSAEVTEPWKGLGVDTSGGTVLYSDESSLSVSYEGADLKGKVEGVMNHLKSSDCAEQFAFTEAQGSYSWSCKKGEKTYGLSGSELSGTQILSVIVY